MSKTTTEHVETTSSYMTGLVITPSPDHQPFTAEKIEILSSDNWPVIIQGTVLQNGNEARRITIWFRKIYSDGFYNVLIDYDSAIVSYNNHGDHYVNWGADEYIELTVTDNGKRLTGKIASVAMLNSQERHVYMTIAFEAENANTKKTTTTNPPTKPLVKK